MPRQHAAVTSAAPTAIVQKHQRHPALPAITPPAAGAMIGAMVASMITTAYSCAARGPWTRSRIEAFIVTTVADPPTPWMNRAMSMTVMSWVRAHRTAPVMKTARPMSNGPRRPHASENGPNTNCPPAMANR